MHPFISSHFDFGSPDPEIQANSVNAIDAFDTLHELIHQARSSGFYSDRTLAQAIFTLLTPAERREHPLPRSVG
jgi:hypothetical protein